MTTLHPQARSAKLIVQKIGEELIVYDRQSKQIRRLNRTAATIWQHCDGRHSVTNLVALARLELQAPKLPARVVEQALLRLQETDLLQGKLRERARMAPPSRRSVRDRLTAGVPVGVVDSMLAPTPAMTASGVGCGSPCADDSDCASATDGCVWCSKPQPAATLSSPKPRRRTVTAGYVCVDAPVPGPS